MITLEGYARRDSGAANLILSDDAHALAATPERVVTVGDFGDIVGQKATVYHGMSLADGWKTIPGEILLQFSGTLKTARGGLSSVQEGTIVREMSQSTGETENNAQIRARYVDLGPASTGGFVVAYHVEEIHFRDRARLTVGLTHAVSATTNPYGAQRGQLCHQYNRAPVPSEGLSLSGSKRVGRPGDTLGRPSPLVDLEPPKIPT